MQLKDSLDWFRHGLVSVKKSISIEGYFNLYKIPNPIYAYCPILCNAARS